MEENTVYPYIQKCDEITITYDEEGKATLTNAYGQNDMSQNYIKMLQQQVKDLEAELKVTKEDADEKAKMAQGILVCLMKIYENAESIEEAKNIIHDDLHEVVKDLFK
ncbi:hypothetical protein [Clostridium sp. DJ247]|uniref:hypothetical protein n=1 Tax=Clostridium sp. DJ247 TaxID=2726188 RepID=UPI001623BEB4|nr:hypothetical protein [Clostridium sp. DJ247]MBC2579969.1 hypothetical protein [Clostridium sp. DJ247]